MAKRIWRVFVASALAAFAPDLLPPVASVAFAQASGMSGFGETTAISIRATVKALDVQARTITLSGPNGDVTLDIDPRLRAVGQVKPGDTVIARYEGAIVYVLAPPGTKLPPNSTAVTSASARPGSGQARGKIVFSGLVVGVDPVAHTLSLRNPAGGPVHTVDVVTDAAKQHMKHVKVGDTITAVMTGELLVSIEPAP